MIFTSLPNIKVSYFFEFMRGFSFLCLILAGLQSSSDLCNDVLHLSLGPSVGRQHMVNLCVTGFGIWFTFALKFWNLLCNPALLFKGFIFFIFDENVTYVVVVKV